MEKQQPIRPLCLELEDAKAEIFAVINMAKKKHNIPFFLLENIVAEAARQTSEFAAKERETAALAYEKELADFQKGEGDNE